MSNLHTANDFAKWMDPKKKEYYIDNIILYGSVALRGEGKDIDIMLVHHNTVFEEIQRMVFERRFKDAYDVFLEINKLLQKNNYAPILDLLEIDSCNRALRDDLLHIRFVDVRVFSDKQFYDIEYSRNITKTFFEDVLKYAWTWNPKTEKFDIPMRDVYKISPVK
jgi:predicted nucleotidyltransferase